MTLYVPAHFDAASDALCFDVIEAFPFAPMITTTASGEPLVSHVPFLLDRARGDHGTLVGHVSRANPHVDAVLAGASVLAVFTGPHAYISPTWYERHPAVPTWNYCVVHASGVSRELDSAATRGYLARLADHFEGDRAHAWRFDAQPTDYQDKMLRGITAFELPIARLQGKAKLSQNRTPADVAHVIAALASSERDGDRELARWMSRALSPNGDA